MNAKVLCAGEGISRRGTGDETPFSGDVIRKMLNVGPPTAGEKNEIEAYGLVAWYNGIAGKSCLNQINYVPSFHILDCTELVVNFYNEKYVIRKGHLQNHSVFLPYSGESRKPSEKSQ